MKLPLIKDSKGLPSVTMTAFVLGAVVVNLKLLLSGMTLGGFSMSDFNGSDYAASMSALGAIYVLRRNFGNPDSGEDK